MNLKFPSDYTPLNIKSSREDNWNFYFKTALILKSNPINKNDLAEELKKEFNFEKSNFNDFINTFFANDNLVHLYLDQDEAFNKINKILNLKKEKNDDEILNSINLLDSTEFFNNIVKIYFLQNKDNIDNFLGKLLYLFSSLENIANEVSGILTKIPYYVYQIKLNEIIKDPLSLKILNNNNFIYLSDFLNLPIFNILCLFLNKIELNLLSFSNLSIENKAFEKILIDCFKLLPEKSSLFLYSLKNLSIKEISNKFQVSESNVSYYINKAENLISYKLFPFFTNLNLYIKLHMGKNNYLSIDNIYFSNSLLNDLIPIYIEIINKNFSLNYIFNNKYHVIYNRKFSLESIIKQALNKMKSSYLFYEIDHLSKFYEEIIKQRYLISNNGIYNKRKSDIDFNNIIISILSNFFQNGFYSPYSNKIKNKDFEKFCLILKEKYNINTEKLTQLNLTKRINEIKEIIPIDTSIYVVKSQIKNISLDLANTIISFIYKENKTILLNTILQVFKDDLSKYNIRNISFLKAQLIPYLPKDFKIIGNQIVYKESLSKQILDYSKNSAKPFTNLTLSKYFNIKNPNYFNTYLNNLFNEGLIKIDRNSYLYYKNFNLSSEELSYIKENAINLLKKSKNEFVSRNNLFNSLKNTIYLKKEPLLTIDVLFNLVHYLLKDDYYFSLSNYSKNISDLTNEKLLFDFIYSKNKITISEISDFINTNKLRIQLSYLDIISSISSDYVYIDLNTLLKKTKFKISGEELEKFDYEIDLSLNFMGSIDTKTFNNYDVLPKLIYPLNKYLLVGIIQTFFKNKYEIIHTDNNYLKTEYVIKKN